MRVWRQCSNHLRLAVRLWRKLGCALVLVQRELSRGRLPTGSSLLVCHATPVLHSANLRSLLLLRRSARKALLLASAWAGARALKEPFVAPRATAKWLGPAFEHAVPKGGCGCKTGARCSERGAALKSLLALGQRRRKLQLRAGYQPARQAPCRRAPNTSR